MKPFYLAVAEAGFNPLTCDPALLKAHISHLMEAGKVGADGQRKPESRYSITYFKTLLAAHRLATHAKGLPEIAGRVDLEKLLRGYNRKYGAELPRCGKSALFPRDLVAIERNAREGSTPVAATVRVAVTLGCDPDLGLGTARLGRLRFADITIHEDRVELDTTAHDCPEKVVIMAQPDDPACAVTALKSLRKARHNAIRAKLGSTPTADQVDAQNIFINARTGKPLTSPGLKHIVNEACAGIVSSAATKGGLPQLTPELRREVLAPGVSVKVARDLMMIFHTTFSSARVGEAALFDVGDIKVFGRDEYGNETLIPLVDELLPDGTGIRGMLSRTGKITDTDLLDHSRESLVASGTVAGVRNRFKHGTKTQNYHENYYPAQPGLSACPVRILMQWIVAYDRLMVTHHGRRLTGGDPLYTSLIHPGRRFTADQMSDLLGDVVKTAVSGLGFDPDRFSGHSLRKVRTTYVLTKGGSQVNVMKHDGRSSEASNLPYAPYRPARPLRRGPDQKLLR